jgi:hypothetical protein
MRLTLLTGMLAVSIKLVLKWCRIEVGWTGFLSKLVLESEECKEATKKRKSDAGAEPSRKCTKVSGRKAVPAKVSVAPKGASVSPSKIFRARATHATQASKAGIAPGTSVPLRAMAPSVMTMSKTTKTMAATMTASRAGVLKISTGAKRPAVTLSPLVK